MQAVPPILWAATVTLLMGSFYFYTAVRVGVLRGQHNIKAPATSGHPQFDRAYRVQLNTLEQLGIILPFLWIAALYPIRFAWITPLIGVVWLLARLMYLRQYMADPEKRILPAGIGGLTNLAMFIVALGGVLRAWLTST
jgi:glutathione S-transferase